MTLVSKTCIRINEKGKWVEDKHPKLPCPQVGDVITHRVRRSFQDVALYYANIIDYARVVMTVVALILMIDENATTDPTSWRNITIAILIFGSVLLDWVDGPVARYFGQSSVMGCGWDWLADIFAQYCLAIWCMYMSQNSTFKLFTVLFTGVEISTGLFDFAVSAQSVYPSQSDSHNVPWYAIVEEWLTPGQVYNNLGTFCWLANTMYPISICLQMHSVIVYSLAPFALLYAWHEVSQLLFIVQNFKETTATLHQQGIEYMRECDSTEIERLKIAYEQTAKTSGSPMAGEPAEDNGDNNASPKKKEITWVNLFNNGKHAPCFDQHPLKQELSDWVRSLVKENYPLEPDRAILSYGFITAPKHGKKDQTWHFDYGEKVSNLFVPMTEVTPKNGTQFIRGTLKTDMPANNYFPEPNEVMRLEGANHMEICQVISKPYTLLKLYPGTCHRGIANGEDYDRVLFFVTTNPTEMDLGESSYSNKEVGSAATAKDKDI